MRNAVKFLVPALLFIFSAPLVSAATFVSGTISTNTTWAVTNSPYVIQESVVVSDGVTLTIEPGVVVKFDLNGALTIYGGTLNVLGTAADKVYFTSIKDDSVSGDTNGDGGATVPQAGDWEFIRFVKFISTAVGNLNYTIIRYAGRVNGRSINNDDGNLIISNSQVVDTASPGSSGFIGAGIIQFNGSSTIISTEFSNQGVGFYFAGGTAIISQSGIHNNSSYGVFNSIANVVNAKNNWWGSPLGPFHPTLNPSGAGNRVSDNVDFIPWLTIDPLLPLSLSNLGQFKSDGAVAIAESGVTTEDAVTFKAILSDPNGNQVKLQVESRPMSQPFTGADDGGILSSGFVSPGSQATALKTGLAVGQYHWRARAVNVNGLSSPWQEFGIAGNVDFEIKLVPLYTQVRSLYPSDEETLSWEALQYGTGNYADCTDTTASNRSTIRRCGCAIASAVMMLRYHNVMNGADGLDANPLNINAWLNTNSGYTSGGNLMWPQIPKYALGKVRFDGIVPFKDNATLDNYLAAGNPVVLYEASVGHFLLADGKLSSTYTVRDPRWYNTRYLTQTITDSFTRNYSNDFTSLRLFSSSANPVASNGIYMSVASPAELLLTDPAGHRLGKDPVSGASYNEIPSGSYYQEGISSAEDNPLPPHESKIIWIPNPSSEGTYNLQVIGTGEGTYALDTLIYDSDGNTHAQTFASTTSLNNVALYSVNFTPTEPANIQVQEIFDKIPPEAIIHFDTASRQLKVEGTDNISQTAVEQQGGNYTIKDMSGNALLLTFNTLRQSDRAIDMELASLKYNDETAIAPPKTTLKFSWMLDQKTQSLKSLDQSIGVSGQFEVKASYQSMKNTTVVSITKGSGKNKDTIRQTLPGLAIIKLSTKSGGLDFGF